MQEFSFSDLAISAELFRRKALCWAEKFNQLAYFDGNEITYLHNGFENLLAVSGEKTVAISPEKVFDKLAEVSASGRFWCGLLGYDLKNQVEKLESRHPDLTGFPEAHFFEPEVLFTFTEKTVAISAEKVAPAEILHQVLATLIPEI
ncbi:MAG TPA: hypothetical protein VK927_04230, partial [Adhaeribacter sp.]|nr:hypothetical protein [Adhaeribacter sp.]